MATALTDRPVTADDLLAMADGKHLELIEGRVVEMAPAGFEHGSVTARVLSRLAVFVEMRNLGVVTSEATGYRVSRAPDTVRSPDIGFVRSSRAGTTAGYFEGAPDLAVEVVSPGDLWGEVTEKVDMWLAAGAKSVWVVDPKRRKVFLQHQPGGTLTDAGATLTDPLLPGFEMDVAGVFPK